MIFLTVGSQFSFDRLAKAVDEACGRGIISEEVFGQLGESTYQPKNYQYTKILNKKQYDDYFGRASAIISHAGMGTIIMALESNKPLLVLPRLAEYGEVVNNHQVDIAQRFSQDGYLLAAADTEDLMGKIVTFKQFVPKPGTSQSEKVIGRIKQFLENIKK